MADSELANLIELLRARGLSYAELLEAYAGAPSIPATAFATELTPLETAAVYLVSHRKLERKQVAKLLNRSASVIQNALRNAQRKGIKVRDDDTPYRIPTTAFVKDLTPTEAIVRCLHEQYGLSNKEIAKLIGRDQRNTWKALHGGAQ